MRKIADQFLRLNNRKKVFYADDFEKAGYPKAIPTNGSWEEWHRFCGEAFVDGQGNRTYTWTGHVWWFLTESTCMVFSLRFGNSALGKK